MIKKDMFTTTRKRLFCLLMLWIPMVAAIASTETAPAQADYQWLIAPYLWLPDVDGDIGMGPLSVPLDLSAVDIGGNLDAAFMGYLRYGNDRQFFYAEGIGIRFRDREFKPFFNQAVDARVLMGELGYGRHYTLELPTAREVRFSPYIGLRHTRIDVEISSHDARLKADESWLDLAMGVIAEGPLRGKLSWAVKLDGAGFNIDKARYYNLVAGFQYPVTKRSTLVAGYRWTRFRAEPGGGNDLELELNGNGPQLGLMISL
ncbi:MAG: hypothetical protein WDA24_12145 [Tissierellales bacterium]